MQSKRRLFNTRSVLRISTISILASSFLTYLLGPSGTLVYHDALVSTKNESYMVGYNQPFWGANSFTSYPVLVNTVSLTLSTPVSQHADIIKTQYPYKPKKSFILRHIFPATLFVMVISLSVFSDRRKYYIGADETIEDLESKKIELKNNTFDRIRFFWLLPQLNTRIKGCIERKQSLFKHMQKVFDEQSEHCNSYGNLYFRILNQALAQKQSCIKVKLKLDSHDTVVRRSNRNNTSRTEYTFVSRNYNAVGSQFIKQLGIRDNPLVCCPPANIDLVSEAQHSLVNGLNNLAGLFNMDGLIRFESSNQEDADYIISVESTISELITPDGGSPMINHNNLCDGGIFAMPEGDIGKSYYLRPRYRFILTVDAKQYAYFPYHRYCLASETKSNSDHHQEFSNSLLKMDMNFAVGEFLMSLINLPQNQPIALKQLDPELRFNRDREMALLEKLRLTMNKSYVQDKSESKKYDLYSSAYVTKIISDNAKMIRNEILFSVLQRFHMTNRL